jgi:hypothetical protein
MSKKAKKPVRKAARKATVAPLATTNSAEIATAIAGIAEKMPESWDIDRLLECLGEIGYLNSISTAIRAHVIATYGTNEDRGKVIEYLKSDFGNGDVFRD